MKIFLGFIRKEFYHIFRDYRTMLILFGMPITQVLIFGFIISTEIKNSGIAILDNSKDNITAEISQKITSSDFFILKENLSSSNDIEDIFKKGEIKLVIIFEHNFAQNLTKNRSAKIQLIADASDPNTANMLVNYTSGILMDYINENSPPNLSAIKIEPEVIMKYNNSLKSAYMFVPGTMALILLLISALMTSVSIAREKELGTMEVLLVSPLKPLYIIIGKVIPYVGIAFIDAILIIGLGFFVFEVPIRGSLILLLAENLLFITLALSLGMIISTISKTQQVAMFISMFALLMPTMLLSGFIFPVENMPIVLQWISAVMPARWFIVIIKNIMLKGLGFSFVWKETLILAGVTLLFIGLSIKKFKTRLD